MPYLLDYVESELAPIDERPFGPVDAAVLTQASMFDGAGIVPEPSGAPALLDRMRCALAPDRVGVRFEDLLCAERFDRMFTGLVADDLKRLLYVLAASPRFRGVRLCGYRSVFDEASHTQFAATSFRWGSGLSFIGFRGTDASVTGWRENFDMTYRPEVRAQSLARDYLELMAPRLPGELHVGGHSKGGNLALYAALTCTDRVRARIGRIWCLDAPGFKPGRFGEADYACIQGRLFRAGPQDSIVGALLECPVGARTVRSSAEGLFQHSVFSWEVADAAAGGEGPSPAPSGRAAADFVYLDGPSEFSRVLHEVLLEWLAGMDDARRERVVDALFAAFAAAGARDAGDVLLGGVNPIQLAIDAARNLDDASASVLREALSELASIVTRRAGEDIARALFG